MRRIDVAIVGGGPAGLAMAIESARRGVSTIVFERQGANPDKACGEGLMPAGWRALEALGATRYLPPEARSPFAGIRFLQESGTVVAGRFRDGSGVGVRRLALSEALRQAALDQGAEIRHHTPVRDVRPSEDGATFVASEEPFEARLLVVADGLASPLRRQLGLDGPVVRSRRFGLRRHFRGVTTSGCVDVHWSGDVEGYVTPVGEGRCGVAFLFEAGGIEPPSFEALLSRFPRLEQQLADAVPESAVRGSGPLHRRVKDVVHHRIVLLGDAAGYVDAITGEGLSLAFESALALGALLPEALARPSGPRPLDRYRGAHARLFRRYALAARTLLWLARRPALRRTLFEICGRWPGLFEAALHIAASSDAIRSETTGSPEIASGRTGSEAESCRIG